MQNWRRAPGLVCRPRLSSEKRRSYDRKSSEGADSNYPVMLLQRKLDLFHHIHPIIGSVFNFFFILILLLNCLLNIYSVLSILISEMFAKLSKNYYHYSSKITYNYDIITYLELKHLLQLFRLPNHHPQQCLLHPH